MKLIKKIFVSFIIMIGIIIMSNLSKVEAVEYNWGDDISKLQVNDTIKIPHWHYVRNKRLLCIQQDNHWYQDSYNFTVKYIVTIEGKKAVCNGKEIEDNVNAKFAYILNCSSCDQYARTSFELPFKGEKELTEANEPRSYWPNVFVWDMLYEWRNSVGKALGIPSALFQAGQSNTGISKIVRRSAAEYSNSLKTTSTTDNTNIDKISATQQYINGVEYVKVGPFNWIFPNNLNNITIINQNNDIVGISKVINNDGNVININDVESGKNFYLCVPTNVTEIKSYKAECGSGLLCAKIYLLESPTPGSQNLMIRDPYTKSLSIEKTINKKLTGGLKIIKVDSDNTNIKLKDVTFTITGPSYSTGKDFKTNASGIIELKDLIPGSYSVIEKGNPNYGYNVITEGNVNVKAGSTAEKTITNKKQTGNLQIIKKDKDSDSILNNFEFKIVNGDGKYIIAKDSNGEVQTTVTGSITLGSMEYTTTDSNATTFKTDEEGKISIYNILQGTYTINEVGVPNAPEKDYSYYDVDENYIWWKVSNDGGANWNTETSGNASITVGRQESDKTSSDTESNISDKVTILNRRKYIDISGYVWEDILYNDGKENLRNDLSSDGELDSSDNKLANIKVTLYNSSGTQMSTTTTDTSGNYKFIKQEIDSLIGAYIEFEYNGMAYQCVLPYNDNNISVSDSEKREEIIQSKGSKAVEINKISDTETIDLREEFNSKFETITNNNAKSTTGEDTELKYDYENHKSTLDYEIVDSSKPSTGYTGQTPPVTNVADKYIIASSTKTIYNNEIFGETTESIRTSGLDEIKNINFGICKREQPDLAATEEIGDVKIKLNGYTHTYNYPRKNRGDSDYNEDNFNVGVQFENKYVNSSFTRTVYSSDVSYNKQEGGETGKLKVYVTYKISIGNYNSDFESKVQEIVNYYDNRYIIETDEEEGIPIYTLDGNSKNEIRYTIDNNYASETVKTESGTDVYYKKVNILANQDIGSSPKDIYIRYRLNNDAINSILNGNVTLNSISEILSYSTYKNGKIYGGIDKNSNPGTTDPTDLDKERNEIAKYSFENDTGFAPSLRLILQEGRVIKGTVWEDKALESELAKSGYDKRRIGDGKYTTDENVVNNVNVELLNANDLSVVTLYQFNVANKTDLRKRTAEMTTGDINAECRGSSVGSNLESQGDYEFSGVIPGKYVLRFTYGNTSVMYDTNGNKLGEIKDFGGIDAYKSTIYRGGTPHTTDQNDKTYWYWYRAETSKDSTENRLSDAKDKNGVKNTNGGTEEFDIIQYRTTSKENLNYNQIVNEEKQLEKIKAESHEFEMPIDYDINDKISDGTKELKFIFDQMDFGIIERPRQNLLVEKQIAYVELSLSNNNVIISGDPRVETLPGLQILGNDIKIDLESELTQKATLKVVYEIVVDNSNVEIDYNDPRYYDYYELTEGTRKEDVYKTVQIKNLVDYVSNDLSIDIKNQPDWMDVEVIESESEPSAGKYALIKNENISEAAWKKAKTYNHIIATSKFADLEPGQGKISVKLEASKTLYNTDDLTMDNEIEINEYKERAITNTTPGNYIPGLLQSIDEWLDVHEADDDAVNITITPPYGENRNYVQFIIIGTISLIILATGVVLIKKIVLRD